MGQGWAWRQRLMDGVTDITHTGTSVSQYSAPVVQIVCPVTNVSPRNRQKSQENNSETTAEGRTESSKSPKDSHDTSYPNKITETLEEVKTYKSLEDLEISLCAAGWRKWVMPVCGSHALVDPSCSPVLGLWSAPASMNDTFKRRFNGFNGDFSLKQLGLVQNVSDTRVSCVFFMCFTVSESIPRPNKCWKACCDIMWMLSMQEHQRATSQVNQAG